MAEPSERELLKLILSHGYSSVQEWEGPSMVEDDEDRPRLELTIDNSTELPPEWHEWFRRFLADIGYRSFWERRSRTSDVR